MDGGGAGDRLKELEAEVGRLGAALIESRTRLSALMENMPDVLFIKDAEGRYVEANEAFLRTAGRGREEVIGRTDADIFPADAAKAFADEDRQVREAGAPCRFEESLDYQGRRLTFLTHKFPLPGGLVAGIGTEISERKDAEEALRESEARLRALTDNLPMAMVYQVLTSRDMKERRYTYVSASCERITRITAQQAMDDPSALMGLISPDEIESVLEAERRAAQGLSVIDIEISGTRADGAPVRSRVVSQPRLLPDGQLLWDGILIDITERKLALETAERTAALLRAVGDATSDLIFAKDLDCRLIYGNAATAAAIGVRQEQLLGLANADVARDPAEARAFDENDRRIMEGGKGEIVEERLTSPQGSTRIFRSAKTPMRDASGAVIGLAAVATDITERKESEERLRESEERLRVALSAGSLGDWSWDAKTDIVTMSEQGAALFGIPPGTSLTWTEMQALIDPEDAALAAAAVERAMAERADYSVEYRVTLPDGRRVWIHAVGRPIYGDSGEAVGMVGAVQDITARRAAEESLREQSRILETLNRTGAAVAAELDLQRLVQLVTDAGVELTGAHFGAFFYNVLNEVGESYMLYTLAGAERSSFDHFGMPRATAVFHPTFMGEGTIRSDDIKKDPRYGKNDPHFGMPSGHLPVTSYLAVPVAGRSGEVIGGLFFGHPERAQFTEAHERLITGIAAQAAVGIDNARLYQSAQKELQERERAQAQLRNLNETLEQRVAEEVARRAEAEEALRQAQKMETLGQLTGGVAHDFNNLLQIVTGNLEILQRNLPQDSARLRRATDNAIKGAERAVMLTQRLLAFSRRQPLAPRPLDLNKLVAGMSELLHRTLGETIDVETVLASGLWRVEADSNQLENAILNLAVNARDAMPEGGKLTIETSNTHLDKAYTLQNAEVTPGQYVVICVSDTGVGMAADTVQRVFEPFFTTKDVGKGTGLGLSMVYGFVKQSGGHVKVYSEPGDGTTVKLYLPRLHGEHFEEADEDETRVPEGTRGETILVCEDDDDVRAYSVEVLRELGYRVVEAHDGPSALRLLQRQEGKVDLLFTDVVLPGGMTGAVLAQEAKAQRPELKVLFTTGYARNAIVHHGRLDPGVELLTKPFTYADLASRVRDILDSKG